MTLVRPRELLSLSGLDDGNADVERTTGYLEQTNNTACACLRPLHDYDVNLPNVLF